MGTVQLQNYTLQQCSQEENSASQYCLRAGLVSSLRVLIVLGLRLVLGLGLVLQLECE